jgi:hypothetical protein
MNKTTETIHRGTERDYLLWRLNQIHQHGINPGHADYVGVRKTGQWSELQK